MQVSESETKSGSGQAQTRETAALLGALLRYLFLYDRGEQLRAVERNDLTLTQCKSMLAIATAADAGNGQEEKTIAVKDLAEQIGVSVAAMSRALDGLENRRLVRRTTDATDRRVKRLSITGGGRAVVEDLLRTRIAGLEDFTSALTQEQRESLDDALRSLLEIPELAAAYSSLKEIQAK